MVSYRRRRADTSMPLRESEAIILRRFPLGEGDLLVSFLSRSLGRMRGVARGARRPKSRFGSTLEPLSYVHIWVLEKETRELVRITQCELLESFLDTHRDYDCSVALGVLSEVTDALLPEREASDAAFRLLLLSARTVKATGKASLVLAYFVLWTVRLGGWMPDLDRCAKCERLFARQPAYGSGSRQGLRCSDCRLPGMRLISVRGLDAGRRMLLEKLDRVAKAEESGMVTRDLTDFLLDVIEHHMERKLSTRRVLEAAREGMG